MVFILFGNPILTGSGDPVLESPSGGFRVRMDNTGLKIKQNFPIPQNGRYTNRGVGSDAIRACQRILLRLNLSDGYFYCREKGELKSAVYPGCPVNARYREEMSRGDVVMRRRGGKKGVGVDVKAGRWGGAGQSCGMFGRGGTGIGGRAGVCVGDSRVKYVLQVAASNTG